MNVSNFTPFLIGIGLVLYLAFSQVRTRNYAPNALWQIPLLLVAAGGVVVVGQHAWTDATNARLVILSTGIGIVSGIMRGVVNQVQRDSHSRMLTVYGSVKDLVVWVATIVVFVGIRSIITGQVGFDTEATLPSVLLFFGLTLLFQRLCWSLKAIESKEIS